jgi:hypothetical protein
MPTPLNPSGMLSQAHARSTSARKNFNHASPFTRLTLQVLKKFVQQGRSDGSTGGVASGLR